MENNKPLKHNLDDQIEQTIENLSMELSIENKIRCLSGDLPVFPFIFSMLQIYNKAPYPAGGRTGKRNGSVQFTDGPRGVVINHSTCFPVSIARAATWDVALEERVGEAIGKEASAQGANLVGALCLNVLRHPAWGRSQESYGEDTYLIGEFGASLVRGLQKHVMACVKHFACNSIEDNRMRVNVEIDERSLHEIYLPQFRRCVDEGVACVMTAYNRLNGEYCAENSRLLRGILKDGWGFKGFVVSDFVLGLHDGEKAIRAGLDLEMPFSIHYGNKLLASVRKGKVPDDLIDDAFRRIQRELLINNLRSANLPDLDETVVASPEHCNLAREVAEKSIVLLQNRAPHGQSSIGDEQISIFSSLQYRRQAGNVKIMKVYQPTWIGPAGEHDLTNPVLPLDPNNIRRLAVIGDLAATPNIGDRGSSMVRPPYVITPLQGIEDFARGKFELDYKTGTSPSEAISLARRSDAVIYFAGLTQKDEGENFFIHGGDKKDLELSAEEKALLYAIAAANPRTVVVLMGGCPILVNEWIDFVPAIMMVWYPGMEGGRAICDILFGKLNPSGKLPVTIPKSIDQLPPFDNKSATVTYGYYHGYRLIDKENFKPSFPFGYGLSYTRYEYSSLIVDVEKVGEESFLNIQVNVSNTGSMAGEEVIQTYIGYPSSIGGVKKTFHKNVVMSATNPQQIQEFERPLKELKSFSRIYLEIGETKSIALHVPVSSLRYYNPNLKKWIVESGMHTVYVGGSSDSENLLSVPCVIDIQEVGD